MHYEKWVQLVGRKEEREELAFFRRCVFFPRQASEHFLRKGFSSVTPS